MSREHKKDFWDQLVVDDKKSVLKHANLGFGVVVERDAFGTMKFGKPLLNLGLDSFAKPEYPGGGGYDAKAAETLDELHRRDFGLTETKANLGLSGTIEGVTGGASGSTSSSSSKETTHDSKKTTYYMYAEYLVNMVTLTVKEDMPPIAPAFQKELEEVVDGSGVGVQKLVSVYDVLNKYGWYVPKSITLGGKLVETREVITDKETDSSKIESEFSEEFKANVSVPGVFSADGGGSRHTKNQHDRSSTHYESVSAGHLRYVGGSQSALNNGGLNDWLDSLNDALEWEVVGVELFPVLAYMPPKLLNAVKEYQQAHGAYAEMREKADVNTQGYFVETEVALPQEDEDW